MEIEKVNATSSVFPSYFITFRARDNVSKQTDTYETKVCYRIPDNFFEMRLFRKKGTKKGRVIISRMSMSLPSFFDIFSYCLMNAGF